MLLSQFLEDETLLSTAPQAALLITPELIVADRYFDINRGVAGTILGLLALHKTNPDEKSTLNLAIDCGKYLIEQQPTIDGFKNIRHLLKRM